MECFHCGDVVKRLTCPVCDKEMDRVCFDCHVEVKHGIIQNHNIHIVGGSRHLCSADEDYDAYSPSWKAGN